MGQGDSILMNPEFSESLAGNSQQEEGRGITLKESLSIITSTAAGMV